MKFTFRFLLALSCFGVLVLGILLLGQAPSYWTLAVCVTASLLLAYLTRSDFE